LCNNNATNVHHPLLSNAGYDVVILAIRVSSFYPVYINGARLSYPKPPPPGSGDQRAPNLKQRA